MIKMKDDQFDPNTDKDLLDQRQKSFMSDSIQDEPTSEDDSLRAGLVSRWCWCCSIDAWKQHFDVTQGQILGRLFKSIFPFTSEPLFENKKPDLYGPLWIFVSLNISMAIFGYLWVFIDSKFEEIEYTDAMHINRIYNTYGFLMFYFLFIPIGVYFLLSFLLLEKSPSYPKILSVYGYSMWIFIPVSFMFLIPVEVARWIILIVAGLISLWILFRELVMDGLEYLPEFQIYLIGGSQWLLHVVFIIMLKFYFFV